MAWEEVSVAQLKRKFFNFMITAFMVANSVFSPRKTQQNFNLDSDIEMKNLFLFILLKTFFYILESPILEYSLVMNKSRKYSFFDIQVDKNE